MTAVKAGRACYGAESGVVNPLPIMTVTAALQHHHRHCDSLFAEAERTAAQGEWESCAAAFGEFATQLEQHFRTEEEILFPAFEAATGMMQGPTQVMRMEHAQMRSLLERLQGTLATRDADGFGGDAETLLILMQQHNMKEESILYPRCDSTLDDATGQAIAAAVEAT